MQIIYKDYKQFKVGSEADFRYLERPSIGETWHLGIDGSSTSYGLSLHTPGYKDVRLFIFAREHYETPETFRESLYQWLHQYFSGVMIDTVTYERTPEGYKPPSNRAEKVMRDTERAVRTFVTDNNYLLVKSKDYIFDIFPNSWKSYSVPYSRDNIGKVDKEENARAVLESCGLNVEEWIKDFHYTGINHDYDCFEALGAARYGSEFLKLENGSVRIFKNFSRIGTSLICAKRLDDDNGLGAEVEFVGRFSKGRQPRISSLNEMHSLPENLLGLYDKDVLNILIVPHDHPYSIYIDLAFGFELDDNRDYIILGTRTSKTELSSKVCEDYGFSPIYI